MLTKCGVFYQFSRKKLCSSFSSCQPKLLIFSSSTIDFQHCSLSLALVGAQSNVSNQTRQIKCFLAFQHYLFQSMVNSFFDVVVIQKKPAMSVLKCGRLPQPNYYQPTMQLMCFCCGCAIQSFEIYDFQQKHTFKCYSHWNQKVQ